MKLLISIVLGVTLNAAAATKFSPPSLATRFNFKKELGPNPILERWKNATPKDVNSNIAMCQDSELTVECLSEMKGGGIGLSKHCIRVLPDKVLDNLTSKLCKNLTAQGAENVPVDLRFWKAFMKANDWRQNPIPAIIEHIVTDRPDFLETLMDDDKVPPSLLAHFFTAKTMQHMPASVCGKMTKKLVSSLNPNALEKVSLECFQKIPPDVFIEMGRSLFKRINPLAFQVLTVNQARNVTLFTFTSLTVAQAQHLGPEFTVPPDLDSLSDVEQQEFRNLALNHPCIGVRSIKNLSSRSSKVIKALQERCTLVWANKAGMGMSPVGLGSLLLLALGSIVLLV